MRYVERDSKGKIIADYASLQPGIAEELLPENHPDFLAREQEIKNRKDFTSQPAQRCQSYLGISLAELKMLLVNITVGQCKTRLDGVTSLASGRSTKPDSNTIIRG